MKMTKKNMKKIIIGVFLISFGLFLFVISVYFLNVRHNLLNKAKAKLASITISAQKPLKKTSDSQKQSKILNLYADDNTSSKNKPSRGSTYQIQPNKEGLLWIDRKTGRYLVTLGKEAGLVPGTRLDVYQEETLLGEVVVDSVSEHVSIVRLTSGLLSLMTQDYYRVLTK